MSGGCIWRCANSAFKLRQAYEFWISGWNSGIAMGVEMGQMFDLSAALGNGEQDTVSADAI